MSCSLCDKALKKRMACFNCEAVVCAECSESMPVYDDSNRSKIRQVCERCIPILQAKRVTSLQQQAEKSKPTGDAGNDKNTKTPEQDSTSVPAPAPAEALAVASEADIRRQLRLNAMKERNQKNQSRGLGASLTGRVQTAATAAKGTEPHISPVPARPSPDVASPAPREEPARHADVESEPRGGGEAGDIADSSTGAATNAAPGAAREGGTAGKRPVTPAQAAMAKRMAQFRSSTNPTCTAQGAKAHLVNSITARLTALGRDVPFGLALQSTDTLEKMLKSLGTPNAEE